MAVLVGISQTPRLARRIQHITFSLDELRESFNDYLSRPDYFRKRNREDRIAFRSQRRSHECLLRDQELYVEGRMQRDLTEIMKNLSENESMPFIWARDGDPPDVPLLWKWRYPAGARKLHSSLGYTDCMQLPRKRDTRPVEALWRAISEAGLPVRSLELGSYCRSLPIRNLGVPELERIPMHNLQTLHLTLWSGGRESTSNEWMGGLAGLGLLLRKAPVLVSLSLTLDEKGACDEFHASLLTNLCMVARGSENFSKGLTQLRRLQLQGIQIEPNAIMSFVDALPHYLDKIWLTAIPVWSYDFDDLSARLINDWEIPQCRISGFRDGLNL